MPCPCAADYGFGALVDHEPAEHPAGALAMAAAECEGQATQRDPLQGRLRLPQQAKFLQRGAALQLTRLKPEA
eukprot:2039739-Pyramimonas_sp.AAC.1